jgi:hypothetical protein
MSTAAQTKQYDRGYEDAIERRMPRSENVYYVNGYVQGRMLASEQTKPWWDEEVAC